ncbi:hypothetical protein GGI21_004225, partial [Coemansia aciculifera]
MLLRPLQWVCCNLRAVAYPLYHSHLEFTLSSLTYSAGDPSGSRTGHLNLARKIRIHVDDRSIYSGEALEVLTHAPFEDCAFPLARSLTFIFGVDSAYDDIVFDPLQIENNIGLFAQRVKKMSPVVKEIGVRVEQNVLNGGDVRFGRLVSHLIQSVGRINLDLAMDFSRHNELRLDWISNLTHMTYRFRKLGHQPVELVQQNAST